jgi:hypothetical protein
VDGEYRGFCSDRVPTVGLASAAGTPPLQHLEDSRLAVLAFNFNRICQAADMVNAVKGGQLGSTFLFEAFDEPWKHDSHWGLWDQNGNPKFAIPSGL